MNEFQSELLKRKGNKKKDNKENDDELFAKWTKEQESLLAECLPIKALVLAGLPTTKIFAFDFPNLPIAWPCPTKIPPLIWRRSARSSIFLPLNTMPLGILPTKRNQSAS